MLEQALPSRREAAAAGEAAEDVSAECAICYAYRLPPAEGAEEGGEEGVWAQLLVGWTGVTARLGWGLGWGGHAGMLLR